MYLKPNRVTEEMLELSQVEDKWHWANNLNAMIEEGYCNNCGLVPSGCIREGCHSLDSKIYFRKFDEICPAKNIDYMTQGVSFNDDNHVLIHNLDTDKFEPLSVEAYKKIANGEKVIVDKYNHVYLQKVGEV